MQQTSIADRGPALPTVPFGDLLGSSDQIRFSVSRIERAMHAITGAFPSQKDGDAPRAVVPHITALRDGLSDSCGRLEHLASHLEALASDGRDQGQNKANGYP